MTITTQRELRRLFWEQHPDLQRKKIANYSGNGRMYVTDTRCAWNDWKDTMSKDNQISQEMAQNAML